MTGFTKVRDFEGRKCSSCSHYEEEWDDNTFCGSHCTFSGQEHFENLKSFPFKNGCKNFVITFWKSKFADMITDDGDDTEALDAYQRYRDNKENSKV